MELHNDAFYEKLYEIGLVQYYDLLKQNELDNFAVWNYLSDADLISIGISSLGARRLLLSSLRTNDLTSPEELKSKTVEGNDDKSDDDSDVYTYKGPEISFKNIITTEEKKNDSSKTSSLDISKVLIAVAVVIIALLLFWLAGGFYHIGEFNQTINRGVYNRGAENAYVAAVSFIKSLPSVPNDAKFDSFSEASVEDFGDEMYRFRFNYKYTYYSDNGSEVLSDRNCMVVISRDSKNNWRVGSHYPTE